MSIYIAFVYGSFLFSVSACSAIANMGFRPRKYWWARLIAIAAAYAGVSVLLSFYTNPFDISFEPLPITLCSLVYLGLFLVVIAASYFFYKANLASIIFTCLTAYAMKQFTEGIFWLLNYPFQKIHHFAIGGLAYYIIWFSVDVATYTILAVVFRNKFKTLPRLIRNRTTWTRMILSFILVITCSVFTLIKSAGTTDLTIFTIMTTYSVVCCLLLMLYLIGFLDFSSLQSNYDVGKRVMEEKERQLAMTKESIKDINIKYHDLKKVVNMLQNKSNVTDEMLQDISNSLNQYDSLVCTGNPTLDTALNQYINYGKQYNITLSCIADGTALSFLDEKDIVSLFCNILDNAVEAVFDLPEEKKKISLNIGTAHGMAFINTSNYYEGQIDFKRGIPQTKKDKRFHGFGMQSIQHVCNKYRGNIHVEMVDSIFTMKILMPIQKRK